MRSIAKCIVLLIVFGAQHVAAENTFKPFAAKFEYELKISVDSKKRDAYLKRENEKPSSYEKVLGSIKESVTVAKLIDTVNVSRDKYSIRSIRTLNYVLSTALGGQGLLRDSVGAISSSGMNTLAYQENLGNTEMMLAQVLTAQKKVKFSRDSSPAGEEAIAGLLKDPVNICSMLIGQNLPTKSLLVNLTDGRTIKKYNLIRAEPWDFPYAGQKVRAIRFYKTTSKKNDSTLEVWFSEKEHIPLRYVVG